MSQLDQRGTLSLLVSRSECMSPFPGSKIWPLTPPHRQLKLNVICLLVMVEKRTFWTHVR